jgi:hypothetical protein
MNLASKSGFTLPPQQLSLVTERFEQSCGLPDNYFRATSRIHAAQI